MPESEHEGITSALEQAEQSIDEMLAVVRARTQEISNETRTDTRVALTSVPEQISKLQLRRILLRNIHENWSRFEEEASSRGIEIRLNQLKGLRELIEFLGRTEQCEQNDSLRGYYHQPTGAGKTGLFSIEAKLLNVPTLILVPFDNLLVQTKNDLISIAGFAPDEVGLVGSGQKEIGRPVTIATYASHISQMKKGNEYATFVLDRCRFVVCDEVHTALGDRTQQSLDAMRQEGVAHPEEDLASETEVLEHMATTFPGVALEVGFTATPLLAKKDVASFFPTRIGREYHADLIDTGVLVPYRIIHCDGTVMNGEIESFESLTEAAEADILQREKIYEKLLIEYADVLLEYRMHKSTIEAPLRGMAFCTNHDECCKLAEEAKKLDLRCRILTGKEAPTGPRGREVIAEAVQQMRKGEIDLLITVEKLCTGFNFPEVNAIIWARITSMAKTIQGIGRGSRAHAEDAWKKECCYVFETNWALEKNAKRGKRPLRIADALAENGEDPHRICSMRNNSQLDVVTAVTAESLRAEVLRQGYTADSWSIMTSKERGKAKFLGYGLRAIGTIFGIDESPIGYRDAHLQLGREIFGEHPVLEQITQEKLRAAITRVYTPQTWCNLNREEKGRIKFFGIGLRAISARFGVSGDAFRNNDAHLQLGREIFGEHPVLGQITQEKLRAAITRVYTPQTWLKLTFTDKAAVRFFDLGLGAIATKFGVDANPINYKVAYLQLARAIFGDQAVYDEQIDSLRSEIIKHHNAQSWAAMTALMKREVSFSGLGLRGIATRLGITGNPIQKHDVHLQIGRAIFGDTLDLQDVMPEKLREAIMSNYTVEAWKEMTYRMRKSLKIHRKGLCWIKTKFGVVGDPIADQAVHLELGRKIWGEDSM